MPVNPTDILQVAEQLHANAVGECGHRSAVSRAYYAALHETRDTFGVQPRVGHATSHDAIIGSAEVYGKGANPARMSASTIAQMLPRLRRARNMADYELGESISPQEASDEIERAKSVMRLCSEVRLRRDAAQAQQ